MSSLTYEQMADAILNYYSSGSTIWNKVNLGNASSAEILQAFSNIPQLQAVRSTSGVVLGYDYAEPLRQMVTYSDDLASAFNSNLGSGSYSDGVVDALIPANFGGGGMNPYTVSGGAAVSGGGVASVLSTPVSPLAAVAGVSLACKLGAKIDSALYSLDPEWWDTHYPTINPETWASIAGTNSLGQAVVRTLFGVDSAGNSTAYMSTEMLAYTYQLLRDSGAFTTGYTINEGGEENFPILTGFPTPTTLKSSYTMLADSPRPSYTISGDKIAGFKTANGYPTFVLSSKSVGDTVGSYHYGDSSPISLTTVAYQSYTYDNKTVYWVANTPGYSYYTNMDELIDWVAPSGGNFYGPIAWLMEYDVSYSSGISGITKDPNATVPDPNQVTGTTLEEVIQQLKQNYPTLFDGSITSSVMQEDGSIKDYEYVPVPWMDNTTQTTAQPTTGTRTQTQTNISPDTFTQLVPTTPTGTSTNPPDTGNGDGSSDPAPTGSASSLWAVYNPTQTELNSFGSWLWSSNFVEQLKKLFNDPMQAIIGVHKVYATPPTSGSENIKCGYLDSGVSASKVSSQYTSIDCGSVTVREYFGNVFDYEPYTKISIYLPFIGVVPLKTSEVMRGKVSVSYGVDVITGACLAKINITRDNAGGILYSYGGSCVCHYPISSGSYSGIVSGVLTAATGIAAGVATGNPLAAIGGVVAGAKSMHANIQHSGGFTGCAGVMGPKIPYLIIERPQPKMAAGYEGFEGMPANSVVSIGSCSGYAKFKEVHAEIAGAYDEELTEIENILKSGIII